MAKFKKANTLLKVRGIGVVNDNNLTDDLAKRLIDRNPAYASMITDVKIAKDAKKEKGGKPRGSTNGGDTSGGKTAGNSPGIGARAGAKAKA